MGLIFRKKVPLDRDTWVNLSGRGASVSKRLGPVTVNSRGRITIRLGNGFSIRL